jgi:hypothetical protein
MITLRGLKLPERGVYAQLGGSAPPERGHLQAEAEAKEAQAREAEGGAGRRMVGDRA